MVRSKRVYTSAEPVKRRDLRILWSSNAQWSYSGYGTFTKDILKRMRNDGWPVAMVAWYGLDGHPVEIDGVTTYPKIADPYGSDALIHHGNDWRANVIFTMQDIPTLNPQNLQKIVKWIPYFPIDKDPTPQPVLDRVKFAYKLITFSQFGHDTLRKDGYSSTMIPEGIDLELFKPLTNKVELRNKYTIPQQAIHLVMVAANKENPPRKGFQEAIEAFKMFSEKHPEAILSIYIQQLDAAGFPIQQYANYLGLSNKVRVVYDYNTVNKWTSVDINEIYNTADMILHPSQTEGFGLSIVEGQATGVPVIIQRGQSMPELIVEGKTGEIAETAFKRYTNDLSFVNVADPKSVYEAMERQFKKLLDNPNQVSKDCRENIEKNYDIDVLYKTKWVPYLESLQEEILTETPKANTIESNIIK